MSFLIHAIRRFKTIEKRNHCSFYSTRNIQACNNVFQSSGSLEHLRDIPVFPLHDKVNDINHDLARMNEFIEPMLDDIPRVLRWAMEKFDAQIAMTTSFGINSAVLLHAATSIYPNIPVVWVDTGYLPTETYRYAEDLTNAMHLNLHVTSNSTWTPARMEAIHGKLWERDDDLAHELYGRLRKVEPLKNELAILNPNPVLVLSGLRASQTSVRSKMQPIGISNERYKLLPLLRMTDNQVNEYMDQNSLRRHPLEEKQFVTVGDWHSSRPIKDGENPRDTRFQGRFQECGLHVDSLTSSSNIASEINQDVEEPKVQVTENPVIDQQWPELTSKTDIQLIDDAEASSQTNMAVVMVKKITEDGKPCRKCVDVTEKIKNDNLGEWIGKTVVADATDKNSIGMKLAKHFGVSVAPFFLIRDMGPDGKNSDWKTVLSYLQLRQILSKAAKKELSEQ